MVLLKERRRGRVAAAARPSRGLFTGSSLDPYRSPQCRCLPPLLVTAEERDPDRSVLAGAARRFISGAGSWATGGNGILTEDLCVNVSTKAELLASVLVVALPAVLILLVWWAIR
jgi:hypothetical protein